MSSESKTERVKMLLQVACGELTKFLPLDDMIKEHWVSGGEDFTLEQLQASVGGGYYCVSPDSRQIKASGAWLNQRIVDNLLEANGIGYPQNDEGDLYSEIVDFKIYLDEDGNHKSLDKNELLTHYLFEKEGRPIYVGDRVGDIGLELHLEIG